MVGASRWLALKEPVVAREAMNVGSQHAVTLRFGSARKL